MTVNRKIVSTAVLGLAASALLAGAALGSVPAALGEDEAKNVEETVEALGMRMSDLGNALSREFDHDAWLEESREKFDIDNDGLRSLHAAFNKAHESGGRREAAMKDLLAIARERYGDACAEWLAKKDASVESLSERMGALGTEMGAAVSALTHKMKIHGDDAKRVAERAKADAHLALEEALSRLKVDHDGLAKSLAESARARDHLARNADEIREEVRAALDRSMEEMRRSLGAGDARSALERAKLAETLRKLADERGSLDAARERMRRDYTEAHAESARKLAQELARAADSNVEAAEGFRRAREFEAKARVREMEKAEREKALSRRKDEKDALDAARAEIERLRDQIAELESRLKHLERERRVRDV